MDAADSRSEILNSWKEVAQYLGRGVRTVQRWEHELGLPVRRPRGKSRSPIMALREDLDLWVNNSPQAVNYHGNGIEAGSEPIETDVVGVSDTIVESQGLRSKTRILQKEMSQALHVLIANLTRIQGACGNGHRDASALRVDPVQPEIYLNPLY